MRKNTVVLDLLRYSISNKITFGRTIIAKMKILELFANPDIAYVDGTEIITRLEGFYMSSRSGDHEQMALMYQAEEEFDNFFRKLAKNVDRVADGDEAIILSTGFHLAKQPIPSERPEFTVEAGDAQGSICLKRKAFEGANSYVWEYYIGSDVPANDKWLMAGSTTQASFIMMELPLGQKVWFRVAAVTPTGMQPFTEAISKYIS